MSVLAVRQALLNLHKSLGKMPGVKINGDGARKKNPAKKIVKSPRKTTRRKLAKPSSTIVSRGTRKPATKRKGNPVARSTTTHYYVALVPKFSSIDAAKRYAESIMKQHKIDLKIIVDGKHKT